MPFCTQCGHANSDDSRFCSNCGSALRSASGAGVHGSDATSTINLQSVDVDHGVEQVAADTGEAPLSPADQAAVDSLPSGSALLVVRRGPNSGSRFLLDSDVTTAGRHPESDIFLDDVTVSRRHAEFVRQGADYAVRDVGSLNGTYVNRERIEAPVVLAGGDEVQVGKYRLVFFAGTSAPGTRTGGQGSRP
jgi:pSer/pThr/pTyr-binding forkhead associated (FHA) protein